MKLLTLLLISTSLYAGRMGWEYALFSKNADGTLRFKRTHYTMDGCQAHINLYYSGNPDYICLKFR